MSGRELMRSVTSMRVLAELAADHGMPLGTCLAGTGVPEKSLANPAALVTANQELRLIRNMVEYLGERPSLGLEAGRRYHFTAFGTLGLAMISSRTMRGALDVTMRYFGLTFAFTRFQVADRGSETHIVLNDAGIPKELRRFIVERDACALITIQRDLFAQQAPLQRIAFSFDRPAHAPEYEAVFGVSPVFAAPANLAVFDGRLLLLPLPQANELAQRSAEEQCRRMIHERSAQAEIVAQVRERLAASAPYMPDMDTLADQLCMTTRTLRRRLLSENTSFIALRDEVLLNMARELLAAPSLSIEQIGERLGYAESTCFINAFKRWTGQTPHAYRMTVRAERRASGAAL